MNALILVPILLLLVTGAVGLVLGRKGINTKTLVGAWLVLLSACGFIYLAGRVAERERAWRFEIRRLNDEIEAVTAGAEAGGSLAALATEQTQLRRTLDEVETWRNRYWTSAFFKPPTIQPSEDQTGLYEVTGDGVVELQLTGTAELPVNIGAELAIFFPDAEPEDAFLGIFGVNQVERSEEKILSIAIRPLTVPDDRDRQAWDNWELMLRAAAKVPQLLVFEDLPADRWAATIKPDEDEQGEEEVEIEQAATALAEGQGLPGVYWAAVTVENAAAFEGVAEGQSLELDLQTAQQLQQDGAVRIEKVVRRRLLADPLTALRGTRFETADQGDVPAAGIEGIRRKLAVELSSLTLMTDRIGTARQATDREKQTKQQTAAALAKDKADWEEDLTFAKGALTRLEERVTQTDAELSEARRVIVQKRAELRELTAKIMAKTTPPSKRRTVEAPPTRSAAVP